MNKGYKSLKFQWLFTAVFALMSITTSLQASTAMLCDDVTNGGVISIGDNPGLNCGAYDPSTLMSMSPSEGGSGEVEYQWLSSTVGCPNNIGQAITGANSETYDPGTITETTYFIRCSRRAGCGSWFNDGESNCVVLSVGDNHDPECAGTVGGGDCASIIITPGSGTLEVAGLDAAPISSLQVFTSSWAPVFSCFADCDATEMLSLPAGDYLVFVKYYEANYSLICQIDGTFTVNGGNGGGGTGPCDNAGGDSDGDGICDTEDCAPNNPNLPAPLGSACDDGDTNTINDVIVGDGCGCEGTPDGGGNGPDCADITITADNGNITVTGLDSAPISSVQVFTASWSPVYSCFADCAATEVIDIPQAGDYLVFVKYYQSNYALICQVDGTFTVGGGNGGGGNTLPTANDDNGTTPSATPITVSVTSNDTFGTDGPNDGQIVIVQSPSNGTASVGDNGTPNNPTDDVITYTPVAGFSGDDTIVYEITDSNGDTDTATLTITVEADGNGGGTPDCDEDIMITAENGAITVSGLDGAPVSSLQIFTTSWVPQYSCFADCNATETVDLPAGDYLVFVKYYNADYSLICQIDGTFTIGDGGNGGGGNNLPTAVDDSATTDESTPVIIAIVGNDDFGADGPSMEAVTLAISANNGTVEFNDNGTPNDPTDDFAVYTPLDGFTGTDSFAYFISDSNGDITDATVTVTVEPTTTGGEPNCDDIAITTIEGAIVVSGLGGAPVASVQVFTSTWQPVFTCFADCDETTTIPAGAGDYLVFVKYYQTDYTLICQKDGTFTVGGGNNLPVATNDDDTTEQGIAVIIDVTNNDNFGGDGPSNGAIEIVESPSNGTASVDDNGTPANPTDDNIGYTPNADFVGQDQLTYIITDANGDTSEAVVTITVAAPNGLPVASDDAGSTTPSTPVDVAVNTNDDFGTDGPNNGQVMITMSPSNGVAFVNVNGTPNDPTDDFITYTPNAGFVGTDVLTYVIMDSNGDQSSATVTLTVIDDNDTPNAVADLTTTDENTPVNIDVLENDDFGNDGPNAGQIIVIGSPSNGTAFVNNNGTPTNPTDDFITYTPNAGFAGTDQLTYEITDADGETSEAVVTITVVEEPCLANAGTITADANNVALSNGSATISATPAGGLVVPNGYEVLYVLTSGSGLVIEAVSPAPSFTVTEAGDYTIHTLVYDANTLDLSIVTVGTTTGFDVNGLLEQGGGAICAALDVPGAPITVLEENNLPIAIDDTVSVQSGESVATLVVENDDFGDDGASTGQIIITNSPLNGVAFVDNNGTPTNPTDDFIVYTPNAGFVGTDMLTYVIEDADGDTAEAVLTITVEEIPGNPVATDDTATTSEATTVEIMVNINDDYGPLGPNQGQITIVQNPTFGTAFVNDNGTPNSPTDDFIVYTPDAGFVGTDELVYEITDANGNVDTATVTITVTGQPEAQDDTTSTIEGEAVTTLVGDNDNYGPTGPGNQPVMIVTGPSNGTATVDTNGTVDPTDDTVIYTPANGFTGTDELTYKITDAQGNISEATLTITVGDAPDAGDDTATTMEGESVEVSVGDNDDYGSTGPGNQPVMIVTNPANGTATVNTNGTTDPTDDTIIYTPANGFTGTDELTYKITDAQGNISEATITITVEASPICAVRTVTDATTGCGTTGNGERAFYANNLISGVSGDNALYSVQNGVFTEFVDGTATFTGTFINQGNDNVRFNASLQFSGRTFNLPSNGVHHSPCYNENITDWSFYPNMTGTLTGTNALAGGVLSVTPVGQDFQTGTGASLFDQNSLGASSWLDYTIVGHPNGNASFNENGQMDLNWLLSGSATACGTNPNPPTSVCDEADVLFVVGNTTLNAGDQAIMNSLEAKGFTVMLVDAQWADAAAANGKDLIVISSTVLSSDLGNTYRHTAIPTLVLEPWLYDDMEMTDANAFGTAHTSQAVIVDNGHPLTCGLSGTVDIFTSSQEAGYGTPAATGNDFAYVPGSPNKCLIIGWEAGEQMDDIAAPARRVGFFLRDNGAAHLTNDGWKLFNNAVYWALDCNNSCASSQALTAADDDVLNFTAKRNASAVELNWANNTGDKNDYFVVEHSTNGVDFEAITEKASATDVELTFYNVTDDAPTIGENFYRIQLMFNDGTSRYTEIKEVTLNDLVDFGLYPNPTANVVNINLAEVAGQDVEIRTIDQLGRTVAIEQAQATATPHQLNVSDLRNGRYMIMVIANGKKPVAKQLIIMND